MAGANLPISVLPMASSEVALITERGNKQAGNDSGFSHFRIMVLAGDTLPVEVYCHLPVMCEDRNLPYVYIPSKTVRRLGIRYVAADHSGKEPELWS